MPLTTDIFCERLSRHYTHFDVQNRLLFTGHSHQAWPDVALEGLIESFNVAASSVDTKWDTVFEKVEVMRSYLRDFYDDPDGGYTHGENTHNLFVRWLSGLDLSSRQTIVISDTEFYSIARQMDRLQEEGFTIKRVPALPLDGFSARLMEAIDSDTAAVMLSRIYFETGLINNELTECARICREKDIPLMIDDYHGTNVVPLSVRDAGLEDAFILIGGYKYLQWGEGNCFMRFPESCTMRPVITGWFSGFSSLKKGRLPGEVAYDEGHLRFAGATFDGVSAFRGAAVTDFFREQELTPALLRRLYMEHTAYMKYAFLNLDLDPRKIRLSHDYPVGYVGGFLSLRGADAQMYWSKLKDAGVLTDCRGEIMRFGSAPYMVSAQMNQAFGILADIVRGT
jgi:selenocysteine lyase/cysteine desulfurase